MIQPNGLTSARKILLVEDHPDTALALSRLLKLQGHSVCCAVTAGEAVRLAMRDVFDLLISDLSLPDGTGCDVMRRVNALRPTRGICLSGYASDSDVRRTREAGFSEHLAKPTDFRRLLAAIDQAPRG